MTNTDSDQAVSGSDYSRLPQPVNLLREAQELLAKLQERSLSSSTSGSRLDSEVIDSIEVKLKAAKDEIGSRARGASLLRPAVDPLINKTHHEIGSTWNEVGEHISSIRQDAWDRVRDSMLSVLRLADLRQRGLPPPIGMVESDGCAEERMSRAMDSEMGWLRKRIDIARCNGVYVPLSAGHPPSSLEGETPRATTGGPVITRGRETTQYLNSLEVLVGTDDPPADAEDYQRLLAYGASQLSLDVPAAHDLEPAFSPDPDSDSDDDMELVSDNGSDDSSEEDLSLPNPA